MKKLLLYSIFLTLPMIMAAQAGMTDLTFGNNGYVRTDFDEKEDQARGIVATPDGGVVVAGFSSFFGTFWQFSFAKYLEDGSLDPGFANGGQLDFGFPGQDNEFLSDLEQRPDGRLVACGGTYNVNDFIQRVGVVQLNADGSLDQTFGTNGAVEFFYPDSTIMQVPAMSLQPDGKIVLVGVLAVLPQEFMVIRLNADGSLDQSFGNGGYFSFGPLDNGSFAWDCDILANGNIAVVGQALDINPEYYTFVAMVQPSGQLETTFGNGGVALGNYGDQEQYYAVKVQNQTHLLCAGFMETGGNRDAVVRRYDLNGDLDPTFGTGGTATLDYMGFKDDAFDLYLQPDGKILVAMEGEDATEEDDFVCVRLTEDGQFDTSFGTNGWSAENTPIDEDANVITMDVNGKIVMAGTHDDDTSSTGLDYLVKRLESGVNIGINEVESEYGFVFPNPSTGLLNVRLYSSSSSGTLELMDLSGRLLRSYPANGVAIYQRTIELPEELANGQYFIRIIEDGRSQMIPFQLQR